jgi:hypothetical protein
MRKMKTSGETLASQGWLIMQAQTRPPFAKRNVSVMRKTAIDAIPMRKMFFPVMIVPSHQCAAH